MSREHLVADGRRVLSREPSAAISILANLRPKIFEVRGGGVCSSTPQNCGGALIMALHRDLNRDEFMQAGFPIPISVDNPVEILHDVPISVYQAGLRRYTPTGMTAKDVLLKRVGVELGLVLGGDMAGLVLRPEVRADPGKGMCVNRVLNDHRAGERGSPYPPDCPTPLRLSIQDLFSFFRRGEKPGKMFEDIVMRIWSRSESEYTKQIRYTGEELGRTPYESDVIFRLFRQLDIAVDESNFHLTRWLNDIPGPDDTNWEDYYDPREESLLLARMAPFELY